MTTPISLFFTKREKVTQIPTTENFIHYVGNKFYQMKKHLNTSRVLIITSFFIHLISGIVIGGLATFCVQTGSEIEEIKMKQEKMLKDIQKQIIFKDGDIELIPIQIGGKNAK